MARLTIKELRRAMDVELETVWYRLVCKIATLADRQADMAIRSDRQTDQVIELERIVREQTETIQTLTDKVDELTARYETERGWNIEATRRILALEKRENDAVETLHQRINCTAATLRREIRDGDYATLEELAQLRNRVTTHEPQVIADAIRQAHNATMRMDIHSKWIGELFDRLNEKEAKE